MALIVTKCWKINSLGIKAALLQGKGITRDLLIKPPKEVNTTKLWRLNKTVYGLNDASRTWYLRVRDEFIATGARVSKFDEAIFFWHSENKLQGVLCSHVDDFFSGGSVQFKDKVIQQIHSKFLVTHEESTAFVYLGLEMKQLSNEIHLQQSSYIKSITPICTQRGRHKTDKITEEESHQLRGLAGQFNWVANQTRPDTAFKARQTSIAVSNSTVGDIHSANKCVRKLQSENVMIKFKSLGNIKTCSITAYSDATLGNLPGCSSQGGFTIFLHGENGNVIPMSWRSRKIRRVVRSNLAAETIAFIEAAEQSFFI